MGITDTKSMVLDMMDRQSIMNSLVASDTWAVKGIDWRLPIFTELAEMLDSVNNYWWKSTDVSLKDYVTYKDYILHREDNFDILNIQIELVDTWHFFLSYMMSVSPGDSLADKISDMVDGTVINPIPDGIGNTRLALQNEVLSLYPIMFSNPVERVGDFVSVLTTAGMTFEDLYRLYVGKNVLNQFRQANGYKEGIYSKKWMYNGKLVEDNVVMYNIIRELPIDSLDSSLLEKLNELYSPQEVDNV